MAASNSGTNAAEPGKGALPTLSWLEEDDEFEEFDGENWTEKEEDLEEISAWNDSWDDDELNDDFSKQLRAELTKAEQLQAQNQQNQGQTGGSGASGAAGAKK